MHTLSPVVMSSSLTTTWCYISLLLAVAVYLVLGASNTSCPTAFYYNHTTNECDCNPSYFIVCKPEEQRAYIRNGACITSAVVKGSYYFGECPLTLKNWGNNTDRFLSELPSDPDMLNATMCGPYNREGVLCGKCIDGYGLPAYPLDFKCVNCSRFPQGVSILLYLMIVFVPTTLLFVCVVGLRLKITSGPLLGYFLFCQLYLRHIYNKNQHGFDLITIYSSDTTMKVLFQVSQAVSELWALLFPNSLIPSFCISEQLKSVHIQLLTLVPTIYIVVLVITTCILMELHARKYRVLNILWKPFRLLLIKFKITLSCNDSIIHGFATLIFLSSTTLIFNVVMLNVDTSVYFSSGVDTTKINTLLYIDPSVVYHSHEHILYLMISMVPCIFLVFIPALLLCVYPTRIYRRLSQLISTRKQLAITAFAEALHNCFKDGLNGTRDYRALAGLVILVYPVASLLSYIVWKPAFSNYGYSRSCVTDYYSRSCVSGILLFALSLVVSYVRPCKSTLANLSLSYHAFMFGVLEFALDVLYLGPRDQKLTLLIIPLLSHVLVLTWIAFIVCRYIISQDCSRRTWSMLVNASKVWRNRNGYQLVPSTTYGGNR